MYASDFKSVMQILADAIRYAADTYADEQEAHRKTQIDVAKIRVGQYVMNGEEAIARYKDPS